VCDTQLSYKEQTIKVVDIRWFGNRCFRLQETEILGYHIGVYEDDGVCIVTSCTLIEVIDVSGKPVSFVRLDWISEHFTRLQNVRVTKELTHFHNKSDVDCPVTEPRYKLKNPTRKNWREISRTYRTYVPLRSCLASGNSPESTLFVVLRLDAYLSRFPIKQPAAPSAGPGMICAKLMPGVSVCMWERLFSSSIRLQAMTCILSIL
jgi:hypothetical protein